MACIQNNFRRNRMILVSFIVIAIFSKQIFILWEAQKFLSCDLNYIYIIYIYIYYFYF